MECGARRVWIADSGRRIGGRRERIRGWRVELREEIFNLNGANLSFSPLSLTPCLAQKKEKERKKKNTKNKIPLFLFD